MSKTCAERDDVFRGQETVMLLVEIPHDTYLAMKVTFETGKDLGKHELNMEEWSGGLMLQGIKLVQEEQDRMKGRFMIDDSE